MVTRPWSASRTTEPVANPTNATCLGRHLGDRLGPAAVRYFDSGREGRSDCPVASSQFPEGRFPTRTAYIPGCSTLHSMLVTRYDTMVFYGISFNGSDEPTLCVALGMALLTFFFFCLSFLSFVALRALL